MIELRNHFILIHLLEAQIFIIGNQHSFRPRAPGKDNWFPVPNNLIKKGLELPLQFGHSNYVLHINLQIHISLLYFSIYFDMYY